MLERIEQKLLHHRPRIINSQFPEAAVLIPITDTSRPELIFTRRAAHLSTHGGEIAFPGGKRDREDASLEITALRESHEEINLAPETVKVLGRTGSVISRFGLEVTPFVGLIADDTALIPNTDELDVIFKVPLSLFLEPENLRLDQFKTTKKDYCMPAYQFENHLIWGLTAIILVEFLNITLEANIPLDVPQFSESAVRDIG